MNRAGRPRARLIFTALGVAAAAVAFLRGDHLLGLDVGILYAVAAGGLMALLGRALFRPEGPSVVRAALVVALAVPLGVVMADPAAINSDVQVFVDKQATDRAARRELAAVFDSDPAFGDLSVSTAHVKVVNVTIAGSLPGRGDLERLRGRIAAECPTVLLCPLHWDVMLRDIGERRDGLDRDLFRAGG